MPSIVSLSHAVVVGVQARIDWPRVGYPMVRSLEDPSKFQQGKQFAALRTHVHVGRALLPKITAKNKNKNASKNNRIVQKEKRLCIVGWGLYAVGYRGHAAVRGRTSKFGEYAGVRNLLPNAGGTPQCTTYEY